MDTNRKQTSSSPVLCGNDSKGLEAVNLSTLLEAIERIVKLSKNSQMSDDFLLDRHCRVPETDATVAKNQPTQNLR